MPLSCNDSATMSGVSNFLSAELAAPTKRMAGWPVDVRGSASQADDQSCVRGRPRFASPHPASPREPAMSSLTGSTARLRRRLFVVLTATAVGGATAVVLLSAPAAV